MSNYLELNKVLEEIFFVARYKALCEKFNDFEKRLSGNRFDLYESVLSNLTKDYNYNKKEKFFTVLFEEGCILITLQLVLKDGLVEASLVASMENQYFYPYGRLDFIPEKLNIEFDRQRYNLPKYTSKSDLNMILKEIFTISNDILSHLNKVNNLDE